MSSMTQSKKIAFIVTVHWSDEIRPNGQDLLLRYLSSIYEHCNYDFHIFIVDNESQYELSIPDDDKCTHIRIDNQYEKGLTGAWNRGLFEAFNQGYDILINCNDDLWFNNTINNMIECMISHNDSENIIFCPLTNGVLGGNSSQYATEPRTGLGHLSCTAWNLSPNGFMFGMTKKHYDKYKFKKAEYFNEHHSYNEGDGKWGGQEGQWIENQPKGNYGIIVNECFVHHDKIRAWKTPRNIERGIK